MWFAHKNRTAAWRILRGPWSRVWARNRHRADACVAHVDLIIGQDSPTLLRLWKSLRLPHLPDEGDGDETRACLDRDAHLEPGVRTLLHVFLPRVIAGETWLAIAGVTGRRGSSLSFTSNGEPLHERAVEADVELLRPPHTHDVVLILPSQADLDHVLAINRKVIANRHATTRSERQVFALEVLLNDMQRDLESLNGRDGRRQADGEARDLAADREIPFEVCR